MGPLEGHMDFVRSVCWKGSFIASASDDTTIRIWCSKTGATLALFSGHQVPTQKVPIAPLELSRTRDVAGRRELGGV